MDADEEHGVAQAGAGDLVAVGVRDALDEAVLAQPAKVISGLAGCDRSEPIPFLHILAVSDREDVRGQHRPLT